MTLLSSLSSDRLTDIPMHIDYYMYMWVSISRCNWENNSIYCRTNNYFEMSTNENHGVEENESDFIFIVCQYVCVSVFCFAFNWKFLLSFNFFYFFWLSGRLIGVSIDNDSCWQCDTSHGKYILFGFVLKFSCLASQGNFSWVGFVS